MAGPASQRGSLNRVASDWVLRYPDGRIWRVHDLRGWGRSHAHLFGLEDGEHGAIQASSGIAAVKRSMDKRDQVSFHKGGRWSPGCLRAVSRCRLGGTPSRGAVARPCRRQPGGPLSSQAARG